MGLENTNTSTEARFLIEEETTGLLFFRKRFFGCTQISQAALRVKNLYPAFQQITAFAAFKAVEYVLFFFLHRVVRSTPHFPSWAIRASISSCFLVPVVRTPNRLQASFNTGTVSFPRVPFCAWARSSSSATSTLGFFSAPPPVSAAGSVEQKAFN